MEVQGTHIQFPVVRNLLLYPADDFIHLYYANITTIPKHRHTNNTACNMSDFHSTFRSPSNACYSSPRPLLITPASFFGYSNLLQSLRAFPSKHQFGPRRPGPSWAVPFAVSKKFISRFAAVQRQCGRPTGACHRPRLQVRLRCPFLLRWLQFPPAPLHRRTRFPPPLPFRDFVHCLEVASYVQNLNWWSAEK